MVGNGGATTSEFHAGSPAVRGLPSVSPSWMAVIGRQKLQYRLSTKQAIWVSARATSTMANIRAVRRTLSRCVSATCRLICHSTTLRSCHQSAASVWSAVRVVLCAAPTLLISW